MSEDEIKLAAKFYECRDAAKMFFKDDYGKKIEQYKSILNAVMSKHKEDVMEAVLRVISDDKIKYNGFAQMMFLASAVEIIEPTNQTI